MSFLTLLLFFLDFIRFPTYLTMSSKNRSFSFPFYMVFSSFSYLIALARTAGKMLNSGGKSKHTCINPSHGGKAFSVLSLLS